MNKIAPPGTAANNQPAAPAQAAVSAPTPSAPPFQVPGAAAAPQTFAVPDAAPQTASFAFVPGSPSTQMSAAPFGALVPTPGQVNPPESALPPPVEEPIPEAAAKGAKKPRAPKAAPAPADDYIEHHARQCAALQGAFSNPTLSGLTPIDFARFVQDRIDSFEALTGAKGGAS